MNSGHLRSITPAIDIYIKLAQYPILCDKIRLRMREELFRRGIVSQADFEREVKEKALESQRREGLRDPFAEEETNVWQRRKAKVREFQTDAYFANNLGVTLLEQLIEDVLRNQPGPTDAVELTFNPELAPWEMLFRQGELYEALPPPEQEKFAHHLEEIKVVLIKGMISDQLPFIGVAKRMLDMSDLRRIYRRRIGGGKIGGKAAGMILAWKILQQTGPELGPDISTNVEIPDSYFIGTEVIYDFRQMNGLDHYMNEKYRPLDEVRAKFPEIVSAHLSGTFPAEIVEQLRAVLARFGNDPLIVRSSSLLEDNFGYSFAGKYQSHFCPNQGDFEENLEDLLNAIRLVYASTGNPDAILYRRKHGLIDYDERMAILVQRLRGKRYGRYFMPAVAGVGFSQNPFRWNPKIRREDGFLRLVWGIGTRAVDRVDRDYPRMVALSHPELRPETTTRAVRQYSQWHVDVIDLEANAFRTLLVREVLKPDYPDLRYLASLDKGDYLQEVLSLGSVTVADRFVLTFNELLKDRKFVKLIRTALMRLEQAYTIPVDVEFTVEIVPNYPYPDFKLHILQCRPLSQRAESEDVSIPKDIPDERVVFRAHDLIPDGRADQIRFIIFVDPERYSAASPTVKLELGRAIGRLNKKLEDHAFIIIGPGRWGSINAELGVRVSYADIYNTRVLVEVGVAVDGHAPELSYGTHFFQDLVETGIHSLPLPLQNEGNYFNWDFFRQSKNCLEQYSPDDASLAEYLRVIDVAQAIGNQRLTILMDGNSDEAIGFLEDSQQAAADVVTANLSTF